MSVATLSSDDRTASREADLEILTAVLAGDGTAYRGLVEKYQGRVFSMVYGMTRNQEDARDIAQDNQTRTTRRRELIPVAARGKPLWATSFAPSHAQHIYASRR